MLSPLVSNTARALVRSNGRYRQRQYLVRPTTRDLREWRGDRQFLRSFPALDSLQRDLNTSNQLVAASVSLFILGQGIFPLVWSGVSEIQGRKTCYIISLGASPSSSLFSPRLTLFSTVIYCVATAVCSRSQSIGVFIAMRILQSVGSSAVLALGAGTLADIYDNHERGQKLGLYYALPLLGPSLGDFATRVRHDLS